MTLSPLRFPLRITEATAMAGEPRSELWDADGVFVMNTPTVWAEQIAAAVSGWRTIESAPEGQHILLWFPQGERGNGGIEAGTIYRKPSGEWDSCYWTNGGPNAGSDVEFPNGEMPTMWRTIEEPPK